MSQIIYVVYRDRETVDCAFTTRELAEEYATERHSLEKYRYTGDVRVMGRESYLMIHEISAGAGGKIGEINDAVKFYERVCERVVDIFVSRSGGKCSRAQFKKNWNRADWWIDSAEALRWGFVDAVR